MPRRVEFPVITGSSVFGDVKTRISDESDVETFHSTVAYARLTAFIEVVSDAMPDTNLLYPPRGHPSSRVVQVILDILATCRAWIEQCPPHTGHRRFGNLAFREWHAMLRDSDILQPLRAALQVEGLEGALVEIEPYFLGSFGSSQRLDYGTGHELSFFAFLCTLFQLNLLGVAEAGRLGLSVFPFYVQLIQTLVVTYTLEPAGSHGVWGLDDHFAMSYLLGSAQLSHLEPDVIPTPDLVTHHKDVEEFRSQNLYFNAIGFINDVKKGPFWEHSPMLYDISGIPNWAKIATGMKKLYHAEVLGKFPVVQHFPFGNTFFPFTTSSNTTTSTTKSLEQRQTQSLHHDMDKSKVLSINDQHKESKTVQVSTAAPWATNKSTTQSSAATLRMPHSQRPDQNIISTSSSVPRPSPSSEIDTQASFNLEEKEVANVEGMEKGLGVKGLPGTKAPFSQESRTIHPAVLASMKKRGEEP